MIITEQSIAREATETTQKSILAVNKHQLIVQLVVVTHAISKSVSYMQTAYTA